MLETSPGVRITTAALAKEVGVSEAALYRHFPSKSKMFEGLIEFIEETLFNSIPVIMQREGSALERCFRILETLLVFTARNPGFTRLLNGDALVGEHERLRDRVEQLFDRIETQLKQILREAELREGLRPTLSLTATASLMLGAAEGRITQFIRSGFRRDPSEAWREQWDVMTLGLMREQLQTV